MNEYVTSIQMTEMGEIGFNLISKFVLESYREIYTAPVSELPSEGTAVNITSICGEWRVFHKALQ